MKELFITLGILGWVVTLVGFGVLLAHYLKLWRSYDVEEPRNPKDTHWDDESPWL